MVRLSDLKQYGWNVVIPAVWLVGYLIAGMVVGGIYPSWGPVSSAVATDVFVIILGLGYYRQFSGAIEQRYELLPAIGRSVMVFTLWFCADVLGNIIAAYVPDPALDNILTVQSENIIPFLILSILVAPVAEEILFRGIVYSHLRAFGSVWAAAIISSLIFGALHGTLAQFFIGTLFGIAQCFLFEYTRKLRWCMSLHVLVNTGNFAIASLEIPVELFADMSVILFLMIVIGVALAALSPVDDRPLKF